MECQENLPLTDTYDITECMYITEEYFTRIGEEILCLK